ncbi:hypothetical protein COCCU_12240 [Corynebacterium occultum]|uniref:Uncharacterized protein n=1 Tax=Corynebacterium occultum TaxID=2675219 RepID=A0A6B8WPU5_9CORY|nr:hypothetical protein [Corynebacterium occultum]QGU08348.1 hypothetical protein COCCU_12240 [Corynebacterium occultum]
MSTPVGLDSTLTVFLGRGRLAQGIRQTLEDFTATGLIRDLVWVDADAFVSPSSEAIHLRVNADGTPEINRRPFNSLVSQSGASRMHLGIINVIGAEDGILSAVEITALNNALSSFSVGRGIHRTNLMITAVDSPLAAPLPILNGYTNLMLAPEDSLGPESSTVAYYHDHLDPRFTLHCAAGIASLFGIWEGATSAPVSELAPNHGETFRLVRSFYRRIDGQAVQAQLKSRILDTSENPLPRIERPGQEISAQHTQNPAGFAAEAAQGLLEKFEDQLIGDRVSPTVERTRNTSAAAGFKSFLGEWFKNMISTPVRAWGDVRAESSSFATDAVQSTIYGETGSRIRVGGDSLSDAPGHTPAQRDPAQVDLNLRAAAELRPLWEAYKNTAMSLLDAAPRLVGEGEARLPSVVNDGSSSRFTVAKQAVEVIPGPEENFGAELPYALRSVLGEHRVAPYDVVGVQEYEQRLGSQTQVGQRQMGQVRSEFQQWQGRNSQSFAYHVGRGLQERIQQQHQQQANYAAQIEHYRKDKKEVAGPGRAGKIFRWLGWVTFWSAAVFALVWGVENWRAESVMELSTWVRHLNQSETSTKAWLFGIWLALWLLCWILQVYFETRDNIRLRNQRSDVASRLAVALENHSRTKHTIGRLNVAYQQFLSVSQVIGTLLERPFGKIQHTRVEAAIPVNTMPDSLLFAEATPDEQTVSQLAVGFRRKLYRQGWLQDYVDGGMKEAARSFTAENHTPIGVDHLFATTGQGSSGDLARFSQWIAGEKFRSQDRSAPKWNSITAALANDARHEGAAVLTSLQFYRDGKKTEAPNRAPLANSVASGSFHGEIASASGQVGRVLSLDPNFCTHERHANAFDAIGVSEVLVQVGHTAGQSDIAFRSQLSQSASSELLAQMPTEEHHLPPSRGTEAQPFSTQFRPNEQQMPGTGEF